jgi:hypothetical protein
MLGINVITEVFKCEHESVMVRVNFVSTDATILTRLLLTPFQCAAVAKQLIEAAEEGQKAEAGSVMVPCGSIH